MQPYNMFFKRILQLSAERISALCDLLELKKEVQEQAWQIIKSLLAAETSVLIQRHLD